MQTDRRSGIFIRLCAKGQTESIPSNNREGDLGLHARDVGGVEQQTGMEPDTDLDGWAGM
jgi:hypothetical protein